MLRHDVCVATDGVLKVKKATIGVNNSLLKIYG